MAKMTTDELLDVFKEMSVLELSEFLKAFEDEFDVTAAAPVAMGIAPAGGGEAQAVEEGQDEFDVVLSSFGDKKIQVIKEVRSLTSLASRSQGVGRERARRGARGSRPRGGREGQGTARGCGGVRRPVVDLERKPLTACPLWHIFLGTIEQPLATLAQKSRVSYVLSWFFARLDSRQFGRSNPIP